MSNKVFYQHPNLMRALGMHETVMEVMVNVLGGGDSKVLFFFFKDLFKSVAAKNIYTSCFSCPQEIRFPRVVTNCCRFLCYFCRISRQNQRSMFDHLSYLLQNSGIGLGDSAMHLDSLCVCVCVVRYEVGSYMLLCRNAGLHPLGCRGSFLH